MGTYAILLILVALAGSSAAAPRVALGEMITNSG